MSRKHRRDRRPIEEMNLSDIQREVSANVDRWKSAEQRRLDEWHQVEHLPTETAHAYLGARSKHRRRMRANRAMAKCQMPDCTKPAIRLMDIPLGICVGHGMDVATYFDVMAEDYTRDERKRDILAMRRFLQIEREEIAERAQASRKITPGWVYYLLVADRIKIGYTIDVKRRLRSYPPGSQLLALHPGTKQLEHDMHAKFAGARAAGREWFLDTPELRQHIKDVIEQFGEPDRARYEHHGTGRNKSRLKAS